MQEKPGPLAGGEFGRPAEAARALLWDPSQPPPDKLAQEIVVVAARLTDALTEIRRLSRDIEDVEIRNISDDAKLTLIAQYNRRISEICRRLLPE